MEHNLLIRRAGMISSSSSSPSASAPFGSSTIGLHTLAIQLLGGSPAKTFRSRKEIGKQQDYLLDGPSVSISSSEESARTIFLYENACCYIALTDGARRRRTDVFPFTYLRFGTTISSSSSSSSSSFLATGQKAPQNHIRQKYMANTSNNAKKALTFEMCLRRSLFQQETGQVVHRPPSSQPVPRVESRNSARRTGGARRRTRQKIGDIDRQTFF
jgi:hypothetical protein